MLIILLITSFFSAAFYRVSTHEFNRVFNRIQRERQAFEDRQTRGAPIPRLFAPTLEETEFLKKNLFNQLLIINGIILALSGGAAYFLAGRTLQSIKVMVDEQNQFISNSSHELRTPLAILRSEMEGSLLEKRISDKKARKLIESNLEEISRLQQLSNKLLQLAKLHHFNQIKRFGKVNIKSVVDDAFLKVDKLARMKNIKIIKKTETHFVQGNSDNLQQLLVIMIENAIKYSPQNTQITISTAKKSESLEIVIKDQGIGISPKDLPFVFDRFYRSDKSRSQIDGFGFGLSIAQGIIQDHGGSISVDSQVNRGSIFTITLPLSQS